VFRKLLERPAGVHEPAIYTKYIIAGRALNRNLPGVVDDLVLVCEICFMVCCCDCDVCDL